jgi:NADH-quinone oxidoreductase subunit C
MLPDASSLVDLLRQAVPDAAINAADAVDMPTIVVDREHVADVCRVLRDDPALQFVFLADVTAVDRLPAEPRYEVVYHLASLGEAYTAGAATPAVPPQRLRMKARVPGGDPRLPTVTTVYPTAGWPEREVFDLFGLHFEGHPDLRRVLMPEDWEGYPLRKDYPVQIRKDTPAWSPLQLTPDEFAANVRAQREQARDEAARGGHEPEGGSSGRD